MCLSADKLQHTPVYEHTETNRWTHTHTNTMKCSSASKKGSLTFKRGNMKTSHQRISQRSSGWPKLTIQTRLALLSELLLPRSLGLKVCATIEQLSNYQSTVIPGISSLIYPIFFLTPLWSSFSVITKSLDQYTINSPLYPYAETTIPSLLPVLSTHLLCPEMYLS